jgi:uncharacterized protein
LGSLSPLCTGDLLSGEDKMLLDTDFIVHAPADRVWSELLDIDALAGCVPGSALSRLNGEGTLQGELRTQIAGSPRTFVATLRPVDVDEDGRSSSCSLRVRQADGPAFATGLLRARVDDSGQGARVSLALDGRLAATGVAEESVRGEAERLLSELASNLERSLGERASRPAAAEAPAPSRPALAAAPARAPEPSTPAATSSLPVPAPVAAGAGAAGLLALLLALLFRRRSRRRALWLEIRYRW